MTRTLKLVGWSWAAGFVAGVAALYLGGPLVGRGLLHTGGQLVQLDGDQPLHTAQEVRALVAAVADEVVTERVTAMLGRLPASVVRR